MKYATWQMILPSMEKRIVQAGKPPLSEEERAALLEYLRRYSG
jgi:hypothetical protein